MRVRARVCPHVWPKLYGHLYVHGVFLCCHVAVRGHVCEQKGPMRQYRDIQQLLFSIVSLI